MSKELAFLTGTWYTVDVPENCALDKEEIYNAYWDGELPDDVIVKESEVSHIWADDLEGLIEASNSCRAAIKALETGTEGSDIDFAISQLNYAIEKIAGFSL